MSLFNFVKSHVSILEVVQEYVQVKRAGHYLKGPCPFHNETDASFTVSPDKGIFYCFGCHAGGDVVAFVAKAENIGAYEAATHLVETYSLEVPAELMQGSKEDRTKEAESKDRYFALCKAMAQWTHQALKNDDYAQKYCHDRGITPPMIDYFTIGYLPGGMRSVSRFLQAMQQKQILVKELVEYGIVIERKGMYFSPYEERILFPITDVLGRVCGFGGRVFKNNDERAKYYNSKDAAYFSKGKLLFGLSHGKKAMHEQGCAFLVEGYTDCVAMIEHGHYNTVATLGTACTIDHLKILSRHAKKLYVLYDGDAAGQKAILRIAEFCWEVNIDLEIILLPAKEDPASYLEKGGDLSSLIGQARDIFSFFIDSIGSESSGVHIAQKYETGKKLVALIANVRDRFKQDLLLQRAAVVMKVPYESLKELLHAIRQKNAKKSSSASKPTTKQESTLCVSSLERKILFAIINSMHGPTPYSIPNDVTPYFSSDAQALLTTIGTIVKHCQAPDERFKQLAAQTKDEVGAWIHQSSMNGEGDITLEQFEQLLGTFRRKKWKEMVQDLKASLARAEQEQDEEKRQKLMETFLALRHKIEDKGLL